MIIYSDIADALFDIIENETKIRDRKLEAYSHPYMKPEDLLEIEIKDRDYAVDCLIEALRDRLLHT